MKQSSRFRSATKARKHETNAVFPVFVFSWLFLNAALGFVVADVAAQSTTRARVETLASDRLEGRLAGSKGEKLAADYLVSELQKIGVKPLPGRSDYTLPFEFTAG